MSADSNITYPVRTERNRAMGSEVEITTDASPLAIRAAQTVVAMLEQHWSSFRPDSEISRCNTSAGPSVLRPSTARIIEVALAGQRFTGGWFDPTNGTARHHIDNVMVDGDTGLLHLPPGVRIDLGGIGKGWAADLASAILAENGGTFASVSVGGDVRVRSHTRALVQVESPTGALDTPLILGLRDGGVAMSGPTKRFTPDGAHHLTDPFTGKPAACPRSAVVVAASAAGAEILSTAVSIAPIADALAMIEEAGATAWLVDRDGVVSTAGEPQRFLLDRGWTADRSKAGWSPNR